MSGALTLGAALLLGLAASGHCIVMCGGVSAALGLAAAPRAGRHGRVAIVVAYQVGRIGAYALAGALLGGALGFAVDALEADALRRAMRVATAAVLVVGALVALGALRDPGSGLGRLVWPRLAPIGRRLLPVTGVARALAFGAVWGFMPCGFVYTMLAVATLALDAPHAALTMAAFGLGTAPAMVGTALGAPALRRCAAGARGRRVAGAMLALAAVLTVFAPGIVSAAPWLAPWMPFLCSTGPR